MYNLRKLKPVYPTDLIRLGRKRDGGYVINKRIIEKSKVLVSFGISTDWSFEKDYYKYKNRKASIYAFDFSVDFKSFIIDSLSRIKHIFEAQKPVNQILFSIHYLITAFRFKYFFSRRNVHFFKKGISDVNDTIFYKFKHVIDNILPSSSDNDILIKMDIENYEYIVIPELLEYSDKICGLVVEFHDLHMNGHRFQDIVEKADNLGYIISHIHGNNGGGCIAGTNHPMLLEITLVKRSLLSEHELKLFNERKYPLAGIDFPCIVGIEDLTLDF